MIIGAHVVVASPDANADLGFFRDVLGMPAVDAGGGYLILGLPVAEASIHPSEGAIPQHELYLLTDDVEEFVNEMNSQGVECGEPEDQGWGIVVQIKLPSGAPFKIYQPRHARPSDGHH